MILPSSYSGGAPSESSITIELSPREMRPLRRLCRRMGAVLKIKPQEVIHVLAASAIRDCLADTQVAESVIYDIVTRFRLNADEGSSHTPGWPMPPSRH